MSNYLIDTNIITSILKKNKVVIEKVENALLNGEDILINGVSYYEIKRGLLAINALSKLQKFTKFCQELGTIWLDNQAIFDEALSIYSDLKITGRLIEDADILIASIAKTKNMVVVSDDPDFERIKGLQLENWLR